MPSSAKACEVILQASELRSDGAIIDLGSGWGTLLFALARKYPHRRIIGYEMSWLPYLYTWIYRALFRLHHVQLMRKNFLTADLPDASVLICYLHPAGMHALRTKLGSSYKQTMLISNTFALPEAVAEQTIQLVDLYNTPIYIYR
ncbi:hypothetical protein MMIC_P2330 [Mariprofundus micogutta]|uniref:Cyclopropane-fatty-acyl-phospholipid synthase n=1 Tax=Mariprofundus micogutta TaxID=1921010 RepID=A0A1L8CQY9_9PROT|nr:class I SAM-dependent methyltransferase [Mariprofundus micogutta]GAV21346.1 hypothetical protein MMIC_P2330 [Mariprofundus micogutta]